MDNLRQEVLQKCSQRPTPPSVVADDYRSLSSQSLQEMNMLALVESLSKQIAQLEERMESCKSIQTRICAESIDRKTCVFVIYVYINVDDQQ